MERELKEEVSLSQRVTKRLGSMKASGDLDGRGSGEVRGSAPQGKKQRKCSKTSLSCSDNLS